MPQRQHYVPQFYLKRFAFDGKHVYTYDKLKGKCFQAATENIAVEKGFYDLPEELLEKPTDLHLLEGFFSEAEYRMCSVLDELHGAVSASIIVDPAFKVRLMPSLLIQYFRTNKYRHTIGGFSGEQVNSLLRNLLEFRKRELPVSHDRNARTEIDLAFEHAQHILDVEKMFELSKILVTHIWVFGTTSSSMPFCTSDVPVAKISYLNETLDQFASFESSGVQISYPVSPTLTVVVLDNHYFEDLVDLDCHSVEFTDSLVEFFNQVQYAQSHRWIFQARKDLRSINSFFQTHRC